MNTIEQPAPEPVIDPLAEVERRVASLREQLDRVLTDRDRLQKRNDELEATHMLWGRTGKYLPAIGVACDGEYCHEAIGVVGIKTADADVIRNQTIAMAMALGWSVHVSSDDAPDVRPRHYCARCKERR